MSSEKSWGVQYIEKFDIFVILLNPDPLPGHPGREGDNKLNNRSLPTPGDLKDGLVAHARASIACDLALTGEDVPPEESQGV